MQEEEEERFSEERQEARQKEQRRAKRGLNSFLEVSGPQLQNPVTRGLLKRDLSGRGDAIRLQKAIPQKL